MPTIQEINRAFAEAEGTVGKFDLARKEIMGGDVTVGYISENVTRDNYHAYSTLRDWNNFLNNMSEMDRRAYNDGGGQELKEGSHNGTPTPPKMASYGSSSRFIYETLKGEGVFFEQKLPTSIPSSISNMDGYYMTNEIFIEAKCHEIYSKPSFEFREAYGDFYDRLSNSNIGFSYRTPNGRINEEKIEYYLNGSIIDQFDIKQTITHILGIAKACRDGINFTEYRNTKESHHTLTKTPKFVYLVYNPAEIKGRLSTLPRRVWDKVMDKYNKEINFIKDNKQFLKNIFKISLEFLGVEQERIAQLVQDFKIEYADQNNIKTILG